MQLPGEEVVSRDVSAGAVRYERCKDAKTEDLPVTTNQVKQLYERPPSFTDFPPWMEYNPASRTFLLEDGISVGALFELTGRYRGAYTCVHDAAARCDPDRALTDAILKKTMPRGSCRCTSRTIRVFRDSSRRSRTMPSLVRGSQAIPATSSKHCRSISPGLPVRVVSLKTPR